MIDDDDDDDIIVKNVWKKLGEKSTFGIYKLG